MGVTYSRFRDVQRVQCLWFSITDSTYKYMYAHVKCLYDTCTFTFLRNRAGVNIRFFHGRTQTLNSHGLTVNRGALSTINHCNRFIHYFNRVNISPLALILEFRPSVQAPINHEAVHPLLCGYQLGLIDTQYAIVNGCTYREGSRLAGRLKAYFV